jgi:hypothetical protein
MQSQARLRTGAASRTRVTETHSEAGAPRVVVPLWQTSAVSGRSAEAEQFLARAPTGAEFDEPPSSGHGVIPLRQTRAVSTNADALLARALEALLGAEAIRHHHDWVTAWLAPPANIVAETRKLFELVDQLFSDHPIEDGVSHPAERTLQSWVERFPVDSPAALAGKLRSSSYPHRVELLRCLGRMPFRNVRDQATGILADALRSEDIELRDAAVRAFELWREPSLAVILRAHREPTPWLAEYIRRILSQR